MRKVFTLAAVAGLMLLGGCQQESLSDRAFGEKVRRYLVENPEVLREMAEALDKKEAEAALSQKATALKKHRGALERDSRDYVANPGGKITVVQFFDYNCSYCKVAAPDVFTLIDQNPDVRFVFKEFPIIGGAPSERAARIMLAVQQQKGDYLGLHKDFIAARPLDNAAIDRITAAHGLNAASLEKVAEREHVDRHLSQIKALAQELGMQGTPTFIVGDEVIEGANTPALKAAIEKAKKA